jgi:hypothetical protein
MSRKPAAALLLGIWIGLVAVEVGFGLTHPSMSEATSLLDPGFAIEVSGIGDDLPPKFIAPAVDLLSSPAGQIVLCVAPENHRLWATRDLYKLQRAFLL